MSLVRNQFGEGPPVSLFTLGTMRALTSTTQMYEVVKAAFIAGINHLETAPSYGPAEKFLGEAIGRLREEGIEPKDGWVITTKLLPGQGFKESQLQLKRILDRLGIDKIDNLAIHGINLQEHLEWALKGDGARLIKWAKENKFIRQSGFSSHGSFSLIEKALKSKKFQFCSLHLHLFDQERIPLAINALENGIGVMAISPADKGGHLHSPSQTLISDCSPISPIELAYRFLLAQGISTLTIGAAKAKDLDLARKLVNANGPLDEHEQQSLAQLKKQQELRLGETLCGQCRQCLPCPQNVPIPNLLNLRNLTIGHDLEIFAKERYNLIGKAGHWWESINANACEDCGDCLPRCPNKLPIPELLKDTHQRLISTPKRRLWG